jgi:ureidoglycolate lyase
MKTIKAEELSVEKFLPFGSYANLINPDAVKIGTAPIEFFRDMLQQDMGEATIPSFGVCRVENREMIINATEYHNYTAEGIMPLDNDICFHVAPATPPDAAPPLEDMRVFYAPKGTMIVLHPGVWHHAPFSLNGEPVNSLIVLPQRTYANDCHVVELPEPDWIAVER